jgi:hypothetical protein
MVKPAHAQGSRKDDIVFNSSGIPMAGASVHVCYMPATGTPCSPTAAIYSNALLTQALANPTTADGLEKSPTVRPISYIMLTLQ